jgi:non-ribosomal peptide synthetase component F
LAGGLGTTPAAILLAALGQLLRRLTGTSDQVVGAIVADRRLAEFEDVIGFFIDMVPVRLRGDDSGFAAHVGRAGAELRASTEHAAAPIERIVDGLGLARDPSRAPLVQIMFNVLNFDDPVLELPGIQAEPIAVDKPGSPVDITLYAEDRDPGLAIDALFNADLFDSRRIERLLADYVGLLGALVTAPDTPVGAVAPELGRPDPARPTAAPFAPAPPRIGEPAGPSTLPSAASTALVTDVWREVLGAAEIGPTENFFDAGGDSLALAAVRARLADRLGRSVALIDLFHYPNIQALAAFLDGRTGTPEFARTARRAAARRAGRRGRRPAGDDTE